MSNSSFIVANKWFLKISSTVAWRLPAWWAKVSIYWSTFNMTTPSTYYRSLFWSNVCNKCVSTFWSGFRFLQASVLHQLKGKGHVVNLREQKTVQSYRHVGPFQSFTALYSPFVRSSRGWGRSCTEGQNNLQAAPSATPSRHRRQTTQTNRQRTDSVTLFKDPNEIKSCESSSYLRFQLCHFQVQLVQVFVDEGDERLETQLAPVMSLPHVFLVG